MIEIKYFGRIREELRCEQETIAWDGRDTDALLHHLRARGEPWQSALADDRVFKIALNHQLQHQNIHIPEGAQIGILPPVTGG